MREQRQGEDVVPLRVAGSILGQQPDLQPIRHTTRVLQTDGEAGFARAAVGTEVGCAAQEERHSIVVAVVFLLVRPLLRTQHARLACKHEHDGDE